VIIEDDQRKPDLAVQLADKLIQSDKVDVMTGIIWSNLAMAVVPRRGGAGQDSTSRPMPGRRRWPARAATRTISTSPGRTTTCMRRMGAYANTGGLQEELHPRAELSGGPGRADRLQALLQGRNRRARSTPSSARPTMRPRSPDPRFGCRQRVLLPAGRHGHRLHEAICRTAGVEVPLLGPAFSFDQGILQAVGDAALGVKNTSQWSKDIDNETNKAFVESFQAEYGRLPSLYASQGFDTANLLISAMGRRRSPTRTRSARR
jgi:branched-chain amino acid transport system substrate-binding protein